MKKIFKIEDGLFLHDDTIYGFGELLNTKVALLMDGVHKSVVEIDDLDDTDFAEDVTNQLGIQPYEAEVVLSTNGGDEVETAKLFSTAVIQCLEMTALGMVPFGMISSDAEGNINSFERNLTTAVGYWQRAIATLDYVQDEDNPTTGRSLVRVSLSGTLFTNTIDNATSPEELNESYVVLPRFNTSVLEDNDSLMAMSFDLHEKSNVEVD